MPFFAGLRASQKMPVFSKRLTQQINWLTNWQKELDAGRRGRSNITANHFGEN